MFGVQSQNLSDISHLQLLQNQPWILKPYKEAGGSARQFLQSVFDYPSTNNCETFSFMIFQFANILTWAGE